MSIYDLAQDFGPALIDKFKNPIQAVHERETYTPDGQGGQDGVWGALKSFDIAIIPMSSSDSFTSNRVESNNKVVAYAKFTDISDFVNGDRITHDGKIYSVIGDFDIAKAKAVIEFTLDDGTAT